MRLKNAGERLRSVPRRSTEKEDIKGRASWDATALPVVLSNQKRVEKRGPTCDSERLRTSLTTRQSLYYVCFTVITNVHSCVNKKTVDVSSDRNPFSEELHVS